MYTFMKVPLRPEEAIRSSGAIVTDSCEPLLWMLEVNSTVLCKSSTDLNSVHLSSPSNVLLSSKQLQRNFFKKCQNTMRKVKRIYEIIVF